MPPRSTARDRSPAAIRALCDRALALRHRDPDTAVRLAERALADAGAAPSAARRRALAAVGASLSCTTAGVAAGRSALEDALREATAAEDVPLRCRVLNELAANHAATFDHAAALRYAEEAVDLARRSGDPGEEARGLRILGSTHSTTGRFVEALPLLLDALRLREADPAFAGESLDDEILWERGGLFGRIAVVYSNLGRYETAISYYEVALECFGERFPLRTARTLYRMKIAAEEMRALERAEAYARRSLEIYRGQGNGPGTALGLLGLGSVYLEQGKLEAAEDALHEGLRGLEGDPVHAGYYSDGLWMLAEIHLRRGKHAEALRFLERAAPFYESLGRPAAHRAELERRFYRAFKGQGDFERALAHHERFHERQVEHVEEQATVRLSELMVQFDTERAVKDGEISRLRNVELEREIAERREAEAALSRAKAELEETNRELRALSVRDPLTGLFNRRHLDERLAEAFALAQRQVQPLSVALCDIDDFKRINDTYSHAVGDAVIRTVASLLREHVRQSDVVARIGGEEFVVLFPGATFAQACAATEKLRRLVLEHPWHAIHPELRVTVSAGVAAAGTQPNHEKLLSDADRKLYEAKRRGKNRVLV